MPMDDVMAKLQARGLITTSSPCVGCGFIVLISKSLCENCVPRCLKCSSTIDPFTKVGWAAFRMGGRHAFMELPQWHRWCSWCWKMRGMTTAAMATMAFGIGGLSAMSVKAGWLIDFVQLWKAGW